MTKNPSSQYRIDERVFFTMSTVAVVCLLVLAFRFTNAEPCAPVNLSVNASNFFEGSLISFKAETKNGKTYRWNFGDDSREEQAGASVAHAYKLPGVYMVTVLVNGNCDAVTTIEINEAPVIINTDLQPVFTVPDSAIMNQPVNFSDMTPDATAWEWSFGETNRVDSKSQNPAYIYTTDGLKEVFLKINGRPDRVARRFIRVINPNPATGKKKDPDNTRPPLVIRERPKEDTAKTADIPDKPAGDSTRKTPIPEIPMDQVKKFLLDVIAGDKTAADFSKSLCGKTDLTVTLNNKAMPFNEMCKKLEKIRSRRVKDLDFKITQANGCILTLDVSLKKTLI